MARGDLKVFITTRESTCDECGEDLGSRAWISLAGERGALCLSCADLDHLVFVPSGDAALTRRARKHSTLSAVVLKWSRARKRYERQGLLVEEGALEQAEEECLADAEARARRRVRELFPHCPRGAEDAIAEHACLKYSGRVGPSSAAKALDEEAIRLAVAAHVRHAETNYDELLAVGWDRHDARAEVADRLHSVLAAWEGPPA